MKHTYSNRNSDKKASKHRLSLLIVTLIVVSVAGTTSADTPLSLGETLQDREAGGQPARQVGFDASEAETASAYLAEQWGVEVMSIRLTANDHMIDYRYRVLNADKAADLFERQIKPLLVHQDSGKVLAVPETAKLGPLRTSNAPKEGRIYWMFFGNTGNLVKAGDRVSVVIGDFLIEDLIVE